MRLENLFCSSLLTQTSCSVACCIKRGRCSSIYNSPALCIAVHSTGRFTWHPSRICLSTIRSQLADTHFNHLQFVHVFVGCIFTCFLYTKVCIRSLRKPTRNLQKQFVSSSSVRVTKVFWAFETLTSPKPKKLRSKAPRPGEAVGKTPKVRKRVFEACGDGSCTFFDIVWCYFDAGCVVMFDECWMETHVLSKLSYNVVPSTPNYIL